MMSNHLMVAVTATQRTERICSGVNAGARVLPGQIRAGRSSLHITPSPRNSPIH